jgi:hypothetical protein
MADDMYGFRDDGFVLPGAVRFGWHRDGTGEEMDGFFALDTGGNLRFQSEGMGREGAIAARLGKPSDRTNPSLVCR